VPGRKWLRFASHVRAGATLRPLALATLLSLVNSLVIAVVYARVGGSDPYGIYVLALAIIGLASLPTLSGSAIAASRAAAQERVAAWGLFVARLPYCLVVALGLLLTASVIALRGDGAIAAALAAGAVILPGYVGGDVLPGHFLGARLWLKYLRYQAAVQLTSALTVVAAIVFAPTHPWLAIMALGGTTGVLQIWELMKLRAACNATSADHAYARSVTGVAFLGTADVHLDILLTGWLLGPAPTSLVAVARFFPLYLRRIWEVVYPAFFARIAAAAKGHALESVSAFQVPLVATFLVLAALGVLAAPLVIRLFFGDEFVKAASVAQSLLIATAVASTGYLRMTFLRAHDVRRFAILHIVLLGSSLIVLPPLLIAFEVEGVGLKALIIACIYVVTTYLLAQRATRSGGKSIDGDPEFLYDLER
jgi:O-antigen/teichoic acid export membrane protein